MGLSDELVYCFHRLSTYGGRTRLTNRFVRCQNIFTHADLYAPNFNTNRVATRFQTNPERNWARLPATWFVILLEYPKSWSRKKGNPERSVFQIRKNCLHRWSGPLKVPVFESNSSMILESVWEHVSQERSGLVWVDQLETKSGATKKYFVFVLFPVFRRAPRKP